MIKPIDPILRMHLLRHFSSVPQMYIENNFPPEQVPEARTSLNSTRSKFKPGFVSDPDALFEKVLLHQHKMVFNGPDSLRGELSIDYSKDQFPDGVGYDNIMVLSQSNDNTAIKVKPVQLGPVNYPVSYIERSILPVTWTINIIYFKENQDTSIITIFPGTLAPPFPDLQIHSEEQYFQYDTFWKQHAFIELKK